MEKKSYTSSQHCTYFYSGIDLNNAWAKDSVRPASGTYPAKPDPSTPVPRVSEVRFFANKPRIRNSPLS